LPGGNYLGAGIEHDHHGNPSASGRVHQMMNEKRIRKLDPLQRREDLFVLEGDERSPLALVSWGSSAGVAREAWQHATAQGLKVKLLVPKLLFPVSVDVYRGFFSTVAAGLVVEQSHQGQLYRIVRMYVDVPAGVEPFCRPGANPFQPAEIVDRLRQLTLRLQGRTSESSQPRE
jgi:2-oxoglutarate ferredoxin oxidoreductase subunit alpha